MPEGKAAVTQGGDRMASRPGDPERDFGLISAWFSELDAVSRPPVRSSRRRVP